MMKLNLFISLVVLMFSLLGTAKSEDYTMSQDFQDLIARYGVAITCAGGGGVFGGQGTMIKDTKEGTIVITAGHVMDSGDQCVASTHNGKLYKLTRVWSSKKEDLAEGRMEGFHSADLAFISPVHKGEKVYTFGEVDITPVSFSGKIVNFIFTFSQDFYHGHVIAKLQPEALIGYGTGTENMWLVDIYSAHGSSGEGVYDQNGNLVLIVSGAMMSHAIYMVDVRKSIDEKNRDINGKDNKEVEAHSIQDIVNAIKHKK